MATERKYDKVWIELEKPDNMIHAASLCAKANAMLAKLGNKGDWLFFWDDRDHCYCWGGDMGYESLPDRGRWFNLDYLSKEKGE